MTDEWITTNDAASMSGYHANYIRQLVRAGDIEARKFGFVWQINRQSLIDYLDKAQQSGDRRWGPKPPP